MMVVAKTYRMDFTVTTFVTAFTFEEAQKVARRAVSKGQFAVAKFEYSVEKSDGENVMEFMKSETPTPDEGEESPRNFPSECECTDCSNPPNSMFGM